jgi:hypothetical protein
VIHVVERGAIAFLAVPRGGAEPAGAAELERLFLVLAPRGRPALRRLSIRRRRLPDPARGQRFYAHVDRVARTAPRLTDDLREGSGALRVAAVGRYALARHGDHVHLGWTIVRAPAGALAARLGVPATAAFVLAIFARSLPPTRRPPRGDAPFALATPARLDVLGAEVAIVGRLRAREPSLAASEPDGDDGAAELAAALAARPAGQIRSAFTRAPTRR